MKRDDRWSGRAWLREIAARSSRRLLPTTFVLLLALVAIPVLAVAKPRPLPPSPAQEACPIAHIRLNVAYYCDVEFSIPASNGYRIAVTGEVGAGRSAPDDVTLSASKGAVSVNYLGHGRLTATRMTASFGRFGRFSLRFRPSGKVRRVTVPSSCVKGRPPVVTASLGTYVGTIHFEGEGGYSRVLAHHADGGLGDPLAIRPKLECQDRSPGAEEREAHTVHLTATAKTAHGSVAFGAWAGPTFPFTGAGSAGSGDPYTFLVLAFEKQGGTEIIRTVAAPGPGGDFVFDHALDSATVAPPAPFSGSSSFLRSADGSTTWTGSLAVSLPGLGSVPLAGSPFESELGAMAVLMPRSEEEANLH
ncbi:MAG TPA: hypothetical protein VHZ54_14555 [Solirubrobacterales bacterium]|nr:hypothetical protein [Solirubrobacterales bacterium]